MMDIQSIRRDIDALKAEIEATESRLIPCAVQQKAEDTDAITSPGDELPAAVGVPDPSQETKKAVSRTRLSRLPSLSFRFRRSRPPQSDSENEKKANFDNAPGITSPSRRGSDDSDKTLVDTPGKVTDADFEVLNSGDLLTVLAPLVGGIQRLTPSIVDVLDQGSSNTDLEQLRPAHLELCNSLLTLIGKFHITSGRENRAEDGSEKTNVDGHDLEMRQLMLSALRSKVDVEIKRVQKIQQPQQSSQMQQMQQTQPMAPVPTSQPPGIIQSMMSPNPFILHSTSILSPRRPSVPSMSIPNNKGYGTGLGLMATAQQSMWRTNVIRLGSYQNSALFSPSPVAVRRVVGAGVDIGHGGDSGMGR